MINSRAKVLITAEELSDRSADTAKLVILEISDNLNAIPLKRPAIPGAIAVSLESDISGPATEMGGRRPLPDPAMLQANLRRWGIDKDSLVVVYDNSFGSQAGRAWWTLCWAGHPNVRLLDGGLAAWLGAGYGTISGPVDPVGSGNFLVVAGDMPVVDGDEAQEIARTGTLLDARGRTAYEGDLDKPTTGHIPGAICAGAKDVLSQAGYFKSTEELHAMFTALGADGAQPLAVYCGSGNAASFELAGMYACGLEAALYVGSWSAWTGGLKRPTAQGSDRG
jgi:thiosulfate/3-mercaptopyruvate sulfurtransferase